MSKPKEFYLKPVAIGGFQVSLRPVKDGIHVIEAAPVLAEIAQLKKQLAETKKQLDDLIAAELGG